MKKKEKSKLTRRKETEKRNGGAAGTRKRLYEGRINAEPEVKPPTGRVDQPEGGNRQARQLRWV